MSIDLERSLTDLARSVQDDAVAARLDGQVHRMVTRIRRRRAARATATGAVGLGTVTGIAFGGMQLAGRDGGSPPAVPGPEGGVWDPTTWGCGELPERPVVDVDALRGLSLDVGHEDAAAAGGTLRVGSSVGAQDLERLVIDTDPVAYLVRDGVIAAPVAAVTGVAESFPPQVTSEIPLTSCAFPGEPLPAGSYSVVVVQTVERDGTAVELRGGGSVAIAPTLEDAQRLAEGLRTPGRLPECGAEIEEGVGDPRLVLDAPDEVRYDEPDLLVRVGLAGGDAVETPLRPAGTLDVVAVRDGVVVGMAVGTDPAVPSDGWTAAERWAEVTYPILACDVTVGTPTFLTLGEYALHAAVVVEDPETGALTTLVGGPEPFAVVTESGGADGSADAEAELAEAPAREAVAGLLAAAADGRAAEPFPVCGSLVPEPDADEVLALELLLPPQPRYDGGTELRTDAVLRATDGRTVLANRTGPGALVVLAQDGVVVGRGYWDPDGDAEHVEVGPDHVPVLDARGSFVVCATDDEGRTVGVLPPGSYTAHATTQLALKEVMEADGESYSRSDVVTVVSPGVEVLVDAPAG